jgi:hypothetical protein
MHGRQTIRLLLTQVAVLAAAACLSACEGDSPPAPLERRTGSNASVAMVEPLEFRPISYFQANCAMCHGDYGPYLGAEMGQRHDDRMLRRTLDDMAFGPANAPIEEHELDILLAWHRSLIDGRPFVILNQVTTDEDDGAWVRLSGETFPGTRITIQHPAGEVAAEVDRHRWHAMLPAGTSPQSIVLHAQRGQAQTILDLSQAAHSHGQQRR